VRPSRCRHIDAHLNADRTSLPQLHHSREERQDSDRPRGCCALADFCRARDCSVKKQEAQPCARLGPGKISGPSFT